MSAAAAAPAAASVTSELYVGQFHDGEEPSFDIRLSQEEFDEMLEEDKPSYYSLRSLGFTDEQLCAFEKLYRRDQDLEGELEELRNLLMFSHVHTEQMQRAQEHFEQLQQEKVALDEEIDKVFDLLVAALRRKAAGSSQ